jgi:Ca2+-binding EF-hand superfamily protein
MAAAAAASGGLAAFRLARTLQQQIEVRGVGGTEAMGAGACACERRLTHGAKAEKAGEVANRLLREGGFAPLLGFRLLDAQRKGHADRRDVRDFLLRTTRVWASEGDARALLRRYARSDASAARLTYGEFLELVAFDARAHKGAVETFGAAGDAAPDARAEEATSRLLAHRLRVQMQAERGVEVVRDLFNEELRRCGDGLSRLFRAIDAGDKGWLTLDDVARFLAAHNVFPSLSELRLLLTRYAPAPGVPSSISYRSFVEQLLAPPAPLLEHGPSQAAAVWPAATLPQAPRPPLEPLLLARAYEYPADPGSGGASSWRSAASLGSFGSLGGGGGSGGASQVLPASPRSPSSPPLAPLFSRPLSPAPLQRGPASASTPAPRETDTGFSLWGALLRHQLQLERAREAGRQRLLAHPTFSLSEAFRAFDERGAGFFGMDELAAAMARHGAPLGLDELRALLATLDYNRDGRVSYSDFIQSLLPQTAPASDEACARARASHRRQLSTGATAELCAYLRTLAESEVQLRALQRQVADDSACSLRRALFAADASATGLLSGRSLRTLLAAHGVEAADWELAALMARYDPERRGQVTCESFLRMCLGVAK